MDIKELESEILRLISGYGHSAHFYVNNYEREVTNEEGVTIVYTQDIPKSEVFKIIHRIFDKAHREAYEAFKRYKQAQRND